MKITINSKQEKDFVKINFSEKIAQSRFMINKDQEILEIKVPEERKNESAEMDNFSENNYSGS